MHSECPDTPALSAVAAILDRRKDVVCAYVFGSVARGEERPDSDLDIAVLFCGGRARAQKLEDLRLDLRDELESAAGREVDLVVMNHASPDLLHRVLRDGALVIEKDRGARVEFEVQVRNEYFDMLPHLERYRRAGGER